MEVIAKFVGLKMVGGDVHGWLEVRFGFELGYAETRCFGIGQCGSGAHQLKKRHAGAARLVHFVGAGVENETHVRLFVVHRVQRLSRCPSVEVAKTLVVGEVVLRVSGRHPEEVCCLFGVVLDCVDEVGNPSVDLVGLQLRVQALQVGVVELWRVGSGWG